MSLGSTVEISGPCSPSTSVHSWLKLLALGLWVEYATDMLFFLLLLACARPPVPPNVISSVTEAPVTQPQTPFGHPLVIAHRGVPGHLPEHTLAGYERAVEMGADYIEPDLVITSDGHLIARHENELSASTNVAELFPDRRATRTIDGESVTGWFSEDFTLAEVKTLKARQALDFRSSEHDDTYPIPTFDEVLALVKRLEEKTGRRIGLYPETKHPAYFEQLGLPLEAPLLAQLGAHGYQSADDPVFIQSFEEGNLRALNAQTALRLVRLLAPRDLPTDLTQIASYADGIGIHKSSLLVKTVDGGGAVSPQLVEDAHAVGLLVHVYTFRDEPRYLADSYKGDPAAELRDYFGAGIDGVFSDFTDTAVKARDGGE